MDKNLHLSVSRYNALCISSLGNRLQTQSTDDKHGLRSSSGATVTAGQARLATWALCSLGVERELGGLAVQVISIPLAGSVPSPSIPDLGCIAEWRDQLLSTLRAWKESKFAKCGITSK